MKEKKLVSSFLEENLEDHESRPAKKLSDIFPINLHDKQQLVVCMKGHPGCGKSMIAKKLAQYLKAALVDKDDMVTCFSEVKGQAPSIDWNHLTYEAMLAFASTQLSIGSNVILDSPLAHKWIYSAFRDLAERFGAKILLLECFCSNEELWKSWLMKRGFEDQGTARARDQIGSWIQLQTQLLKYNECWKWSEVAVWDQNLKVPDCHIKVDTSLADAFETIVKKLQKEFND